MEEAGVVIDMNTDCAIIFRRSVPLDTTSSGHYCVPIHSGYPIAEVMPILRSDAFSHFLTCKLLYLSKF